MGRIIKLLLKPVVEIRIWWDYVQVEMFARKAHIRNADNLFCTARLRDAISARNAHISAAVLVQFAAPIDELTIARQAAHTVRLDAETKLAILTRQYKPELDALYDNLNYHNSEMADIKNSLNGAHSDLSASNDKRANWYDRASGKGYFTNRGRKLPKTSFFGQNTAEREAIETECAKAGDRIGYWKDQRDEMNRHIDSIKSSISAVKTARDEMYELKNSGYDRRLLSATIKHMTDQADELERQIDDLIAKREQFIRSERAPIDALQADIDQIVANRARFISEFKGAEAKQIRKHAHRAEWLTQRNQ